MDTNYLAPLGTDDRTTLERIEKFISEQFFTDCNLRGRLYGSTFPVRIEHVDFADQIVTFDEAVQSIGEIGEEISVGFKFGPTWSTHWFKVDVEFPTNYERNTDYVFRFDAQSEGAIWLSNGILIQGLSPDFGRTDLKIKPIPKEQCLYVEVSCSDRNGDGEGCGIRPAKMDKVFELKRCEVSEYFEWVHDLLIDFELLHEMAKMLPKQNPRRNQALYTANDMINRLVMANFSEEARAECKTLAENFFSQKNGMGQMTLYAMGNCHIDTAWLWRYQETPRKCARSWASTALLMKDYKECVFAVSQAQQLVWLREKYPLLCREINKLTMEGRFITVGGTWVEMDGNLPSGESMIRQFLYGQNEFKNFDNRYSEIFWLPDTFGYSAQLPQIMRHCGLRFFVTQKMSWSIRNHFPYNSFRWIGLDGSEVLAHFPPHHYVAQVSVKECLESQSNFSDHGRSNIAMMLYGYGDGGGGPDERMLKRAKRLRDCDGVPKVVHAAPEEFFDHLEKDVKNLCTWRGELFLELHNATYTTQAAIKRYNRLLEGILKDHEFLQSVARLISGGGRALTEEWQSVLLNQFHDVLPGSCLKEVVNDAKIIYEKLLHKLSSTKGRTLKFTDDHNDYSCWLFNSCNWPRFFLDGCRLRRIEALSVAKINELESDHCESVFTKLVTEKNHGYRIENQFFTAFIDGAGRVVSFNVRNETADKNPDSSRDVDLIEPNSFANQFVIYDDVPLFWDAWDVMDYHLETRKIIDEYADCVLLKNTPYEACIKVQFNLSEKSSLVQRIYVFAHLPYIVFEVEVKWHESHKFLKVEFPVRINAMDAVYEIQYGHVNRPTHSNTSWDSAKYEVAAHKWMALCEYDRGVALMNDCKYGHSCRNNIMTLSLLRSSKAPDDGADMGDHEFSYALYPFLGTIQKPSNNHSMSVMRAAYEFNMPLRFISGWPHSSFNPNFIKVVGNEGIVIDVIKPAEKEEDVIVLRLYESFGGSANVKLQLNHPRIVSVEVGDGLERSLGVLQIHTVQSESGELDNCVGEVHMEFRAFELKTLLLRLFAI